MGILKNKKFRMISALCIIIALVMALVIPGSVGAGAVDVDLFSGDGNWSASDDNTLLLNDDGSAWGLYSGNLPQIKSDNGNAYLSADIGVEQFEYELFYRFKEESSAGADVKGGKYLNMDIKISAPVEMYSASYGSIYSIKDNTVSDSSWVTAQARALGIYFLNVSGKIVNAGVLQKDFKNAVKEAYASAEADSWISLSLPISGEFDDDIKTIYFEFGKASKSGAGFTFDIDNINITDKLSDDTEDDNTSSDDNEDDTTADAPKGIYREFLTVTDSWKNESTDLYGGVLQVGNESDRMMTQEGVSVSDYEWSIAVDANEGAYANLIIPENQWDYELYARKGYGTDALTVTSLNGMEYIVIRLKIQNKDALKSDYFSKFILGEGRNDSGTYDGSKAMAVSISGKLSDSRDANSVYTAGISQYDFYNALNALNENEWSTVALPINGSFGAEDVAKYVFFDFSKGFNEAVKLDIKSIGFADADYLREQGLISSDVNLILENGPDYKFTDSAWYPQLSVDTKPTNVNAKHKYLKLDLKVGDVDTLIANFKAGSRVSVGGGSFTYGSTADLGLYFEGTDINGVGVTQADIFAAITNAKKALKEGAVASIYVPISGEFVSTSIINKFNMMLTHGNSNLKDIAVSIDNVIITETAPPTVDPDEGEDDVIDPPAGGSGDSSDDNTGDTSGNNPTDGIFVLTEGKDYEFTATQWYPQLKVNVADEKISAKDYVYLSIDITCKDINKIIENTTISSRSSADTGAWSDGVGGPLKIYFEGTDVERIGVGVDSFKSALSAKANELTAGKTVTVDFKLTNADLFKDTSVINKIAFMPSHGDKALLIGGIKISLSNVKLSKTVSDSGSGDSSVDNDPDDAVFVPLAGKNYEFSASQWYPQLNVNVADENVTKKDYITISMDIACKDINRIIENISISSRVAADDGLWTDGDRHPLKIYFEGTDVERIGVTVDAFKTALSLHADELSAGKTVTVDFPIINGNLFKETSVVNNIAFMPTHSAKAEAIKGIKISLSNIKLLKSQSKTEAATKPKWETNVIFSGEEGLWLNNGKASSSLGEREIVSILTWGDTGAAIQVIKEGNNNVIKAENSSAFWNPNFWIKTSNKEYDLKGVGYIQLDIKVDNPDALINAPSFSDGSPSMKGDYSGSAYAIYFNPNGQRNGVGAGVTQSVFRSALKHFSSTLKQGKWVTIELPIDDPEILANAQFDQICFKYGKGLGNDAEGITVYYDNIKFMKGTSKAEYLKSEEEKKEEASDNPEAEEIVKNKVLSSGDITSTLDNIVIDFENKRIFVAEESIVRDLHTYIELSSDFTKQIRYEGSNMANRSKKIEGESFDYVVFDKEGNETIFRIIPCPLDKDGKIIIPDLEEDKPVEKKTNIFENIDWKMWLTILASVVAGAAVMLIIELIRNKKFFNFKKA